MKKYEFVKEDFKEVGPFKDKAYRIKRVSNGELGGYIQSESNLSQEGDCWVGGNAMVYGNARVEDNAMVYGFAKISGDARIYGNAKVYEFTSVCGHAEISGDSKVHGDLNVYGSPKIKGSTSISGRGTICTSGEIIDSILADCGVSDYVSLRGVRAEGIVFRGVGFTKSIGD